MCYQVMELYSACRCLYYQHAIDRCDSYGRHPIQRRTILVGYACIDHSGGQPEGISNACLVPVGYVGYDSDSGYGTLRIASRPSHPSYLLVGRDRYLRPTSGLTSVGAVVNAASDHRSQAHREADTEPMALSTGI
ncbi:hypothetical protein GQ53DRAFT_648676 [Thozetella sp. PMI_491]|nr:hypothetical protein GQ53DRAFT_648676 [Thozetella sp. PMI_491]